MIVGMHKKISVVTTFNQSGYNRYASKMIDTFLTNWPQNIDLVVYSEDCVITQQADNLKVLDFSLTVPELTAFKQQWQHDPRATGQLAQGPVDRKGKQPGIGFKWDAVRFSHKVYAVADAARRLSCDVLYWMDADTVCHSPCSFEFVADQCPDHVGIAYLGRKNKYTECGLYALNLQNTVTQKFLQKFQWMYDNASMGIFTLPEWYDSYVFDHVKNQTKTAYPAWQQLDWSQGLITGEGHPLINSEWGAYLDHLKGNRKAHGRSDDRDLKIKRTEAYWQ